MSSGEVKNFKLIGWVIAPLLLLFALSCAVEQTRFQPTAASRREAFAAGKQKEFLTAMEAQALEAEKNLATSWFPQQYLEAAVEAYGWAANAARSAGQLQKAITYGEKALEIAERTKEPARLFRAIDALVLVYRQVRNFDRARQLIEKGIAVVKELPPNTDPRAFWEGNLYAHLGSDLMRRGEHGKAIDALSLSLSLQESYLSRLRNPVWIDLHRGDLILRLTSLGTAYRRSGKLEEALEQYQRAFKSIREWGLKYAFEGDLYWGLGEAYYQQKTYPLALENFNKALTLAESQSSPAAIRFASGRIGDVLLQTGKPAEAIPYFQRTIEQIESTRSLLGSAEYRQSYFEGALGAYVQMMVAHLQAGSQEDAFNYSERARSRAFLDVLGSRVQLSRVKSILLEEERALQERVAAIRARLAAEEEETGRASLGRELREAEKAYNSFLEKVRKEDKEQASLMTVEPLTLKQVQALLDPGSTLISYFVTANGSRVWVIEKDRMRFVRIPHSKTELTNLVKTLRESIFTLGEKDKFHVASTYLYRYLIQPVLPHIAGKELIIVPHDVLHYLPFHALLSPQGRYLIEDYPIYYLSSASLLQFTTAKRKAKGDKVLAFGNPDLGDPKMDLKFAEVEAQEVRKLYPRSTVLLKKEATEEKSKVLSPQHDIVHFATHAQLSEEDPLSSAILLAKSGKEDGRLEVREIFGMDLKANLVVLSACETGLGKLSSGDELVGLTRAFIYAGTPSVVASLWNVEDSSTAALMASFYKNLRTMSKVEALRQAQLELIRGEARSDLLARRGVGGIGKLGEVPEKKPQSASSVSTSHPYFWAPFILVGDGK